MEDLLKAVAAGKVTEGRGAEAVQLLNQLVAYQPLQKLPIGKIFGKDDAKDFEANVLSCEHGSPAKCKRLCQSFSPLVAVGGVTEDALKDKAVAEFFGNLNDAKVVAGLQLLTPSWVDGFTEVNGFLKKGDLHLGCEGNFHLQTAFNWTTCAPPALLGWTYAEGARWGSDLEWR